MIKLSTFLCCLAMIPAAVVAHPSLLSYFIAMPTATGLVFLARWAAHQEGRGEAVQQIRASK